MTQLLNGNIDSIRNHSRFLCKTDNHLNYSFTKARVLSITVTCNIIYQIQRCPCWCPINFPLYRAISTLLSISVDIHRHEGFQVIVFQLFSFLMEKAVTLKTILKNFSGFVTALQSIFPPFFYQTVQNKLLVIIIDNVRKVLSPESKHLHLKFKKRYCR